MNFAYLISGHVKNYKECLSNHSKLLNTLINDGHNVDCFISTYNKSGILDKGTRFVDIRDNKYDFNLNNISSLDINNICEFFNPKLFNVDINTKYSNSVPDKFLKIVMGDMSSFYHNYRMYKKIIETISLMERYEYENCIEYDFFIRTRFDITVNIKEFILDEYLHGCSSSDMFHDVFFYGKRKILNKLKNINYYMDKLFKEHIQRIKLNEKLEWSRLPFKNPEHLFNDFLNDENIQYKIHDFSPYIPRIKL